MTILIIFPAVEKTFKNKKILITGGTSGLGRSLVSQFLSHGAMVVSIGRNVAIRHENHPNYAAYVCDHASLGDIKKLSLRLKQEYSTFDILINNAGVLSPPEFRPTINGFELSYQVNFLAHVLLTRLLLDKDLLTSGLVVNVSSPIYIRGKLLAENDKKINGYSMLQAYANTKLYMALFSKKLTEEGIPSFSFNPGTFSSGIYRLQKKWFHVLYQVAAPFMKSSDDVAKALCSIITESRWSDGHIVDKKGRTKQLGKYNSSQNQEFWQMVDRQIEDYIN